MNFSSRVSFYVLKFKAPRPPSFLDLQTMGQAAFARFL